MRSFDSDLVDISAWPSREFSIRATFRDTSIKFTSTYDSDDGDSDFWLEDTNGKVHPLDFDVGSGYSTWRVLSRPNLSGVDCTLWYSRDWTVSKDWGTSNWEAAGHTIDSDCSPAIEGSWSWGGIAFVDSGGALVYIRDSDWSNKYTLDSDVAATLGSSKIVLDLYLESGGAWYYVFALSGPDSDNIQRLASYRFQVSPFSVDLNIFPGRIYQDSDITKSPLAALQTYSTGPRTNYVYFMERGRLVYTTLFEEDSDGNGMWGPIESVLPLDVVDVDWSTFQLGGIAQFTSQDISQDVIAVSGQIRRGDLQWDVFLTGVEDRFTIDRWSLITSDVSQFPAPGKLTIDNDSDGHWLTYAAPGIHITADMAGFMLADDDSDLDSDHIAFNVDILTGFNFSSRINSSTTFSTGVGAQADDYDAHLQLGRKLKIELGWADSDGALAYDKFGTFGVDVKQPLNEATGYSVGLGGRGWASKRIDQWEADQSYEYWSQTKMYTSPATREDVHHSIGQWKTDSDKTYLYLDDLNIRGYLYSVWKPSRNMLVQARFISPSGDNSYYAGRRGVATNYYRKSRHEAAVDLDINSEDAEDSDFGHNAIVAVYGSNEHDSDSDGIALYYVRHDEYTLLTSASVLLNDSDAHWLSIQFQDGAIEVRYRHDSDVTWTTAINYVFAESSSPWYRADDRVGRAAAFLESDTPSSLTPGFSSTDEFIPVYDVSVFSASGKVRVDDEWIDYFAQYDQLSSHSLLDNAASDTDWWDPDVHTKKHLHAPAVLATTGETYGDAVTSNSGWGPGLLLYQGDFDNMFDEVFSRIGYDHTEMVYAAQAWLAPDFLFIPDSVTIAVGRMGAPGYPLYVYYLHDDWDNSEPAVDFSGSIIIATGSISDSDWDSDLPWDSDDPEGSDIIRINVPLTVDTDSYPPSGPMPTRGDDNDWIAVTTMPPRSTAYSSYDDTDNYYVLAMQTAPFTNSLGISRFWRTTGWIYAYQDSDVGVGISGQEDVQIINEIWGISNIMANYEIYVHAPTMPGDSDGGLEFANRDDLDRLSLVVVSGPGKGATFELTDYDHRAPEQWVFNITDMDPDEWKDHVGDTDYGYWETQLSVAKARFGVLEDPTGIVIPEQSYVRVFHTLGGEYDDIANQLDWVPITRGQPNIDDSDDARYIESVAAAHGETLVSMQDTARVRVDRMLYHSGEQDIPLERMVRELAAKAGVWNVTAEKTVDSTDTDYYFFDLSGWSTPVWKNPKNNTVVTINAPTADTDVEWGLLFRVDDTDSDVIAEGYRLTYALGSQSLKFYKWAVIDSDYALAQEIPLGKALVGPVTFSIWEDHFSVWDKAGQLWAFCDTDYQSGQYASIIAYSPDSDIIDMSADNDWPTVDRLVDGFIFDMGTRGSQLLSGVIGKTDSRIMWRDTADGGLYVGRVKTRTDDSDDYDYELDSDIVLKEGERYTDLDQKTLVRSEGAGREAAIFAAEVADFAEMGDRGFLFSYHNAPLALSEWETEQEARYAMDDFLSSSHVMNFTATLDPRIEPNDVVRVEIPSILDYSVVVDSINFQVQSGAQEASLDMTVQARVAIF